MAGKRSAKATASLKPKRITAKQRVARKKNIKIARAAKKKGSGKTSPVKFKTKGIRDRMWATEQLMQRRIKSKRKGNTFTINESGRMSQKSLDRNLRLIKGAAKSLKIIK